LSCPLIIFVAVTVADELSLFKVSNHGRVAMLLRLVQVDQSLAYIKLIIG